MLATGLVEILIVLIGASGNWFPPVPYGAPPPGPIGNGTGLPIGPGIIGGETPRALPPAVDENGVAFANRIDESESVSATRDDASK